ncbi:hypothetical protein ALC57_09334 [Trachymyrmex cornetzi]|uniref:Uncharacterized protein n=1 Tax=Trachymyrmex cornetzi TaxID=471704 RepID=A0A151J5U4_9HYME|nr:hypothetical protein ALC57_09334 [Trachymyrmex cornetzi]
MALRELLTKFITIACNLNGKLVVVDYLSKLTDNDEINYSVFGDFAGRCSSTLLCVMYKLGHCGGDVRLRSIISGHLEVRDFYDHEEDDVGGYIADFKQRIAVRGKQ